MAKWLRVKGSDADFGRFAQVAHNWLFAKVGIVYGFLLLTCSGATYYVRTDGSNGNTGTANSSGGAWADMTYASSHLSAGDVLRVQPGTYGRTTLNNSGTLGNPITYLADGSVVCSGFDGTGVSNLTFIAFEITHSVYVNSQDAFDLNGVTDHMTFTDLNIHDVSRSGIHVGSAGATPAYYVIRGCRFYYMGHVGTNVDYSGAAIAGCPVTPHHWLMEYNTLQRCPDAFTAAFGTNIISRNNYEFDALPSYWNATVSTLHIDFDQDGSDGLAVGSRYHIHENDMCGEIPAGSGHFHLIHDTVNAGDTNMLHRGCVVYTVGESGVAGYFTPKEVTYNCTFYDIGNAPETQAAGGGYAVFAYHGATNNLVVNNICHTIVNTNTPPIYFDGSTGASGTLYSNLSFNSYATPGAGFSVTTDPLFVNPLTNSRNFRLQAGSPAVSGGTNVIWITSASSSGTSFTVNDSQLLCDGWGMVDGDTITLANGSTAVITSINWATQTVTVNSSVSWTNGMPVFWGRYAKADIGALPYSSTALTGATISQAGSTYTVTPVGDARGVWFYTNGIPAQWVSTSPYQATIASGTVTAKAYALYAQATPVVTATTSGGGSPSSSQTVLGWGKYGWMRVGQ